MTAFYGVDISSYPGQGLPDIDPLGKLVSGNLLLAQAIINRLFCTPGSYIQSPDFGIDLASFLNNITTISSSSLAIRISKEIRKDIRVDTAQVNVDPAEFAKGNIVIKINIVPVDSSNFSLTVTQAQQNFNVLFEAA